MRRWLPASTLLLGFAWIPQVNANATLPEVAAAVPCVACRGPELHTRALFSQAQWAALERGRILLRSGTEHGLGPKEGRADGLIPFAPERVWAVLTDFEQWPRFMPLITDTEVTQRDGPLCWVRQDYRVMFAAMQHTTLYELEPAEGKLSWTLDKAKRHDIAHSAGGWTLLPVDEGRATLVRYRAAMDPGRDIPEFIERKLRRRSLEGLIAALRGEVQRRAEGPQIARSALP